MPPRARTVDRLRVATVALVVDVLLVGSAVWAYRDAHHEDPGGPYSAFTRQQLARLTARGWQRNPALLPRNLPPGIGRTEESDFFLGSNPITSERRRRAGDGWETYYTVGALPPASGNITGYFVYQRWLRAADHEHEHEHNDCHPATTGNHTVVRRVGDDLVTVCLGPRPTRASRHYWATVPFTDDLSRVTWLRDGDD